MVNCVALVPRIWERVIGVVLRAQGVELVFGLWRGRDLVTGFIIERGCRVGVTGYGNQVGA